MTLVVLVLLWVARGEPTEQTHVAMFLMPPGTTVAECAENHQPAEADADADAIMLGFKCVEIEVKNQSGA